MCGEACHHFPEIAILAARSTAALTEDETGQLTHRHAGSRRFYRGPVGEIHMLRWSGPIRFS